MEIINEQQLLEFLKNCLENKQYKEGLDTIESKKSILEKKYYEVTRFKIEFLLLSSLYFEAQLLIKEELSFPYIPSEFEEFLNQKNKEIQILLHEKQGTTIDLELFEKMDQYDNETLTMLIPKFKEINLNNYIKQLEAILLNPSILNLNKSLILACLSDNKINYLFSLSKNGIVYKVNPSELIDLRQSKNFAYLEKEIALLKNLEKNATDLITQFSMMVLLDYYPAELDTLNCQHLLTASILLTQRMLNNQLCIAKFELHYLKFKKEVDFYQEIINNLIKTI